ncbi:hypothetical protein SLA2020_351500 [Shorea laevis]
MMYPNNEFYDLLDGVYLKTIGERALNKENHLQQGVLLSTFWFFIYVESIVGIEILHYVQESKRAAQNPTTFVGLHL